MIAPRRCSRSFLPPSGSRACLSTACRRLRSPGVCRLPASSGSPSSRIVNFDNAGLLYFMMGLLVVGALRHSLGLWPSVSVFLEVTCVMVILFFSRTGSGRG